MAAARRTHGTQHETPATTVTPSGSYVAEESLPQVQVFLIPESAWSNTLGDLQHHEIGSSRD